MTYAHTFYSQGGRSQDSGQARARKIIRETKAGSPFLFSGAFFWLAGALVSYVAPAAEVSYVIYGGVLVPVGAIAVGKLVHIPLLTRNPYAVLAAIAPAMELAAIPIMIFLRHSNPEALPGILMICEGVHYLIYMWLHMEYYFFILAYLKAFLGILFLFGVVFAGNYGWQLLISGLVSLVAAVLVARDSKRTLALYTK